MLVKSKIDPREAIMSEGEHKQSSFSIKRGRKVKKSEESESKISETKVYQRTR